MSTPLAGAPPVVCNWNVTHSTDLHVSGPSPVGREREVSHSICQPCLRVVHAEIDAAKQASARRRAVS